MGKELFEQQPVFRKWMEKLDGLVYERIGASVLEVLYSREKKRDEPFDRLLYSHPAIFMVEFALSQLLLNCGITPNYVFGTSLGEFTAGALAGVAEAEELLDTIVTQAKCLEKHCEQSGMLAIIHNAGIYHEMPLLHEKSELASVNYDSHFVVSGRRPALERIERFLKSKNILCQALPVSYGFHSSLVDSAASAFTSTLRCTSYNSPRIPLVSGVAGTFLTKIHENYFWEVVRETIRFPKGVQELENGGNHIYLDLGPGGTLANFVKRNLNKDSRSEAYALVTPFAGDMKRLEGVKRLLA